MKGKKKKFFEALKEQLGIVTAAAKQTGISRAAHYKWLKEDPEYRVEVERIDDLVLDFAENALFKLMKDKNTASIIFFLKTKGKKRGYIERPEFQFNKQNNVSVSVTEEKLKEIASAIDEYGV